LAGTLLAKRAQPATAEASTDQQRGYQQTAFFASLDFDLIPKALTLTGGTRWYHYDEFEVGSVFYTETTAPSLVNHPNGACTNAGACGYPLNLHQTESGFSSRANLTWHITPDIMTYYTYSQGYRPGGFNRTRSFFGQFPTLPAEAPYTAGDFATKQYLRPAGYDSNTLINDELGLKSEWLSHRLLLNAAAYRMKWNDVQSMVFDPDHFSNTNWIVNGPSYTIKGVELQLVARVTEGLTLQGSSAWNSTQLANTPCLISAGITRKTPNNPTPGGQCITVVNGAPYSNPWGVLGTSPPFAPPLMFSARLRYDWTAGTCRPFAMLSASHIASMSNAPASFPDGNLPTQNPPTTTLLRYTIPAYTTYAGALGVFEDNWTAQITGSNLSTATLPPTYRRLSSSSRKSQCVLGY
jgi:iron complex outermembrane recepter protein